MSRIKYIIMASFIALMVLLGVIYVINFNSDKKYIKIAVASKDINEGEKIENANINWVKIELEKIEKDNYLTEANISEYRSELLNSDVKRGAVLLKSFLVKEEDYLKKIENLEYIALPIKSATEGVCYKIKRGDKIAVYYTAKKKLVDEILKDKKKIYGAATSETLVTCLLYENLEIIALTNNLGQDTTGTSITDIVVRVTQEQAIELANLKEQGTFTLSIK